MWVSFVIWTLPFFISSLFSYSSHLCQLTCSSQRQIIKPVFWVAFSRNVLAWLHEENMCRCSSRAVSTSYLSPGSRHVSEAVMIPTPKCWVTPSYSNVSRSNTPCIPDPRISGISWNGCLTLLSIGVVMMQ